MDSIKDALYHLHNAIEDLHVSLSPYGREVSVQQNLDKAWLAIDALIPSTQAPNTGNESC